MLLLRFRIIHSRSRGLMESQFSIRKWVYVDIFTHYLASLISLWLFHARQLTETQLSFHFPLHPLILQNSIVFITSSENLRGWLGWQNCIYDLLKESISPYMNNKSTGKLCQFLGKWEIREPFNAILIQQILLFVKCIHHDFSQKAWGRYLSPSPLLSFALVYRNMLWLCNIRVFTLPWFSATNLNLKQQIRRNFQQ